MNTATTWRFTSLLVGFVCFLLVPPLAWGQTRRPAQTPRAVKNLPALKTPEDKLQFLEIIRNSFPALRTSRTSTFTSRDLDDGLERSIAKGTQTPFAQIIDDETFIRRVSLDVTGQTPSPEKIRKFLANTDPRKRSALIDELLETDAYARKWARYWRTVIFHDSTANRNTVNPQALEDWLFEELKKNSPWDRIVGELVSATPTRNANVRPEQNGWNQNHGPNNFILACERNPEIIASQTARIFMGISIGCAECHDHPFDKWKRQQFHEMAAFFSTSRYYMTDQYDPSQRMEMQAKFLLGEEPPVGLTPDQRRVAGAAYLIYNPENYWFSRAYVNRIWNELIGDGFYSVDSLGPDKEVTHQLVVNRIATTFRYSGFDTKWLFRLVLNSRVYQRESQTLTDDSALFAAVRPVRLKPYEVADNVQQIVGVDNGLQREISAAFAVNPSVPQRDLEGSIQQALVLMNNGALNRRLTEGDLKKKLMAINADEAMIGEAFLAVLARRPTDAELARYQKFVKESGNRSEAVTDLLWILINSAEFVTKR